MKKKAFECLLSKVKGKNEEGEVVPKK